MKFNDTLLRGNFCVLDNASVSSDFLKNIYNFLFFEVPEYYQANISASIMLTDMDFLKIGVYFFEQEGDPVAALIKERAEFLSSWSKTPPSQEGKTDERLLSLYFPKKRALEFDISPATPDALFLAHHAKKYLQEGLQKTEPPALKKRLF